MNKPRDRVLIVAHILLTVATALSLGAICCVIYLVIRFW
jgi:hypothetical protein